MASRELPDLEVLFSATAKRENLFQPDSVLSDQGRRRVDLLMPAEEHALRQQEDAYRFKPQFVDVFKTREECLAPVFTVEQTGGASVSFASYPADVPTFSFVKFAVPLTSQVLTERPTPPPQYNCLPVHP
jgi:hypothetical protein